MSVPTQPSWPPLTEEALAQAAANGTLEENHYLDIKRELQGGNPGNREIAKDIAAFSEDGGTIVIGVDEATKPPSLTPVPLANLAERIEQVGRTRVDEAVTVTTTQIPSDANPDEGYLLVHVPVSPRPPHMADNKYYARGDKINIPLSNAEVLRKHESLIAQNVDLAAEALGLIDEVHQRRGFAPVMAVLARPLGARDDLLIELAVSDSARADVVSLCQASAVHQSAEPSLRQPFGVWQRPGGIAATSWSDNSRFEGAERQAEVKFHESGAITLLSGGVVRMYGGVWSEEPRPRVMESVILGHTDLVVRLAAQVALYGFSGSWRFGVAVVGIEGANSFALSATSSYDDQLPIYTDRDYSRAKTASLAEIQQSPHAIVRDLVGQLLRSLSSTSANQFPWLYTP
ncbi:hypothetical protein ABW16_19455 [Mycolicibacter heraklionensis]|uniref:Schlafen AlbA-2 domain-containing protein n=1 Tax=Mycolicibacter heraklionensis TaxID=512402 RepID=A0ABR5FB22_9MYCO|nr:ATP-binding protein [Mycolicibacter heraklionensis]KLO26480.1 hypothetical protein ABW16_19455 [Mycolicibacter heraklionensis]